MKKIVPFNNILDFSTDVSDITAISLEHKINKDNESISGEFLIYGEYKINDGDINHEKFNFELPFDIALGCKYKDDTLIIDVDDFRYELIDRNKIKVDIDLYIDGEEIPEIEEDTREEEIEEEEEEKEEPFFQEIERINLMDNIENDEEVENENENINNNENINIFNGYNDNNDFVTYKVYRVIEGDTIDSILKKYNITREELTSYNIIDNIKVGDKLIIPYNDK